MTIKRNEFFRHPFHCFTFLVSDSIFYQYHRWRVSWTRIPRRSLRLQVFSKNLWQLTTLTELLVNISTWPVILCTTSNMAMTAGTRVGANAMTGHLHDPLLWLSSLGRIKDKWIFSDTLNSVIYCDEKAKWIKWCIMKPIEYIWPSVLTWSPRLIFILIKIYSSRVKQASCDGLACRNYFRSIFGVSEL